MNDRGLIEMSRFFDERGRDYDTVHTSAIGGGIESKNILASFLPDNTESLLDLGVGTGLELTEVFRRFPKISVTGLDISEGMLSQCCERHKGKDLTLIKMSYLDYPFGEKLFDAVMSVMSFHHYDHRVKTQLYRNIRKSLKPGGVYIESDYVITKRGAAAQELEDFYFSELARLRLEDGVYYHYDTPCTIENQIKMLEAAGFGHIEILREYENNLVVVAR